MCKPKTDNNRSYVYSHSKWDGSGIFYIGIGSKAKYYRAYENGKRSKMWGMVVGEYGVVVEIISDNLSWEDACKKEYELITSIGRIDLGTGPLINKTNGGNGAFGVVMSKETKDKIRASKVGKKRLPPSDETRKKQSESLKEKLPKNWHTLHSPEVNKKRGDAIKANYNVVVNQKRREKWTGATNPLAKLVINLETGIFYENLKDAWIASGLPCGRPYFSMMMLNTRKNKTSFTYA